MIGWRERESADRQRRARTAALRDHTEQPAPRALVMLDHDVARGLWVAVAQDFDDAVMIGIDLGVDVAGARADIEETLELVELSVQELLQALAARGAPDREVKVAIGLNEFVQARADGRVVARLRQLAELVQLGVGDALGGKLAAAA